MKSSNERTGIGENIDKGMFIAVLLKMQTTS